MENTIKTRGISSTASMQEKLTLWIAITSWLFRENLPDCEMFHTDELLTADEVAIYLGVHVETVRRKSGYELPTAGKVGNRWRYKRSDIEEYMRRNEGKLRRYHRRNYDQRYGRKIRAKYTGRTRRRVTG